MAKKITDTLLFQSSNYRYNAATKRILGSKNPKRFILKDAEAGTVILDTLIKIEGQSRVRLLALSETDKPVIAGESELPTDPLTTDTAKYTFVYNDPKLPDSILMKFYSGDESNIPTYDPVPFESAVIKRNEFSGYVNFAFNNYRNTVFYFTIQDAKTQNLIQDIDGNNFTGWFYGLYLAGNYTTPTSLKFSQVLIRFADPNEPDDFRKDRFYDQIIGSTPW